MRQKLSLTPDQLQKLNTIYDQTHARFESAPRDAQSGSEADQGRARFKKIRAVLTADQLPKYEQLRG